MNTVQRILLILTTTTAFLSYCLLFIVPVNAQEQKVDVSALVTQILKEYDATLEFTTTKNQYEFPEVTFNILVENVGKNYFTPTGTLKIYDSTNNLITQIDLNPDSAIIQPQQSFNFQKVWSKQGLDFGTYHAQVEVNFGGNEPLKSSLTFSIIPVITTSITIILFGAATYILIFPHHHISLTAPTASVKKDWLITYDQ